MADLALASAGVLHLIESVMQQTCIAGVALTAGDVCVLDGTTAKWAKADANAGALDKPLYLIVNTAAAGLSATGIRLGVVQGFDLAALSYGQRVYLSATAGKLSSGEVATNESQVCTLTGTPTGGTFKLSFNGAESGSVAYDAAAATLQTALRALATIGADGCSVSGSAGGPWTVAFSGGLALQNVPLLVLATNALTGGTTPSMTIVATPEGTTVSMVGHVIPLLNELLGSSPAKGLAFEAVGR